MVILVYNEVMRSVNIKIKTELAIGIILSVAVIISGIILFINKKQTDLIIKNSEDIISQSLIARKKGNANKEVLFATCGENDIYKITKGKKFSVTIDGKESPDYDCLATPAFSQDCRQFAYSACADGKVFVVVNGAPLPGAYDSISEIVFSPDGKKLAYVAGKNEKYTVVLNGSEGKEYQEIGSLQTETKLSSIIFSPDSQNIFYKVVEDQSVFLVVNGKEGKHYSDITNFYFSDDGKQFAYDAKISNKEVTVINNKEVVIANNSTGTANTTTTAANSNNNNNSSSSSSSSSFSSSSSSSSSSFSSSSSSSNNYYRKSGRDIFLDPSRLKVPICQSGDGGCNF